MKNPINANLAEKLQRATTLKTVEAKPQRNDKKKKVANTYYMSPRLHERMAEIRYKRNTSIQGILDEALDLWLKSVGEPGIED
jgi:hypothetical protein